MELIVPAVEDGEKNSYLSEDDMIRLNDPGCDTKTKTDRYSYKQLKDLQSKLMLVAGKSRRNMRTVFIALLRYVLKYCVEMEQLCLGVNKRMAHWSADPAFLFNSSIGFLRFCL